MLTLEPMHAALLNSVKVGGASAIFAISFDEFIMTFFSAGTEPTLPIYIYSQHRFPQKLPSVLALGACILGVSFSVVFFSQWLRRRGTEEGFGAGFQLMTENEAFIRISELSKHFGSVVAVDHDHEEAMTLSDRTAVMSGGEALQIAAPKTLYNNPVNVEFAEFIGQRRSGRRNRCSSSSLPMATTALWRGSSKRRLILATGAISMSLSTAARSLSLSLAGKRKARRSDH